MSVIDDFDVFLNAMRDRLKSGEIKDALGVNAAWLELMDTNRFAKNGFKQYWRDLKRLGEENAKLKSQLSAVTEIARDAIIQILVSSDHVATCRRDDQCSCMNRNIYGESGMLSFAKRKQKQLDEILGEK